MEKKKEKGWTRKNPKPKEKKKTCPRCGIELKETMWYACKENHCPVGLGETYS